MKVRIAFVLCLVAVGLHYYLTNHYYELHMGVSAGDSICNVGGAFSCDVTSASKFASIFGIPIAALGAVTNLLLALLIFGWMTRWTDNLARLSRYTYYLSAFVALVSVVMGLISSFVLGAFCLFCMGTYLVSWTVFGLLHLSLKEVEEKAESFTHYLTTLFGPEGRVYLLFLFAVPVAAVIFNSAIKKQYGADEIAKYVNASILDWQNAPKGNLAALPSMVKGASPDAAKFLIEEFADFRCGHCKNAAPTLKAFVESRKDVMLRFYNFPLDNTCNPAIGGGDGVSCYLAKAVTCAEQQAEKGWLIHDKIFAEQVIFQSMGLNNAIEKVEGFISDAGVSVENFKLCIDSEATTTLVELQAKAGKEMGVNGTPAIYVNRKRLPRGQALPVLNKLHELITAQ